MDIKILLESEKENFTQIRLYREGMFYRAYEHSAFAILQVTTLKVTHKESKALGVTYVSVGFPITSLDKFIQGLPTLSAESEKIVLGVKEPISNEAFLEWKKSVPITSPQSGDKMKMTDRISGKGILELLEVFDLSVHTPIECMVFLAEIKARMKKDIGTDGNII